MLCYTVIKKVQCSNISFATKDAIKVRKVIFLACRTGPKSRISPKNPRVKESRKGERKEMGRVSIYTYKKVDRERNNNKRPPLITSDSATSPQPGLHDYYNTFHPLAVH